MARRPTTARPAKPEPALLAKPREEVRSQLLIRIDAGSDLANREVTGSDGLDSFKSEYQKWDAYNAEFIRRAFTTSEYADEYSFYSVAGGLTARNGSFSELARVARSRVVQKRDRLVSLVERLDLIDESSTALVERTVVHELPVPAQPSIANNKVFLVHGQDEEAKAIVELFIRGCGLEPIILHEQPNGGRTIIEKFDNEADVGFAVVLMTADDVGGRRRGEELASDELKLRARQNVVLELGYFVGRLGRSKVAALKKGDIELPSDIAGVVWTAIDPANGWKLALARELKAAGYEFDVAKALGI